MGVRRCLARSLTNLAPMRTPKSANGTRSNSFRPDSPFTTNLPRGRKTHIHTSPHRTWSVPDASSKPQLNSILIVPQLQVSLKRLQIVDINVAEASDFPRFIQFLICKAFPSALLHPGPERVKFAEGNIIHLIF